MNDSERSRLRSPATNAPEMTIEYGGHLFIANDSNRINEHHRGEVKIDDAVVKEWTDIFGRRIMRLSSLDIKYFLLLAPDKQTVFRHVLPRSFIHRPAEFLINFPVVLDPAPALAQVARFIDINPATDSHWDQLGAYLAADMIRARLGLKNNLNNIEWIKELRDGDLGRKFEPSRNSEYHRAVFPASSQPVYRNNIPNNGNIVVYSKKLGDCIGEFNNSLLIFGDSFSYDVVHFLRELFDIVVHVHYSAIDYQLLSIVKPTTVISELTERFFTRLPSPGDGEPIRAVWFEKATREEGMTSEEFSDLSEDIPPEARRIVNSVKELFGPFKPVLYLGNHSETRETRALLLHRLIREVHDLDGVDGAYKHRTTYWLDLLYKAEQQNAI